MDTDTRNIATRDDTTFTVGQVARMAGISIRTLHHYDDIGLVPPSQRSAAGYRQYLARDMDRLRAVLTWRELDFALDEIAALVDPDPTIDTRDALLDQREHLTTRIERLTRIVAAIDRELEATTMSINLTPEEKLEVFGDWLPEEYEQEAEERWGDTDAWTQSRRRTSSHNKDDWLRLGAESQAIEADFVMLLDASASSESTQAMDVAERHRRHIGDHYYDCSVEMHENLGQMYVQDPRFTAHYDDQRPGLARFVSESITANALRHLD